MEAPRCHGIQGRPICTADSSAHRSTDSVRVSWHFPSNYRPVCFHLSITRNSTTTTPVGFCSAYWCDTPYIWSDNLDTPSPFPAVTNATPLLPASGSTNTSSSIHPPGNGLTLSETGEPFPPKLIEKVTSGQFVEMRDYRQTTSISSNIYSQSKAHFQSSC